MITGCAHPGLENILKVAENFGEIYAVIGGFHKFNKLNLLDDIPIVVPCHCTYKKADIQRLFPQSQRISGVGSVIEI